MGRKEITVKAMRKYIRKKSMTRSLEKRFIDNGLTDLLDGVYARSV